MIFVAIYQTLKSTGTGQLIDFSDFYHRALPGEEVEETHGLRVIKVVVRGPNIDGEYTDGTKFRTIGNLEPYEEKLLQNGVLVRHEMPDQDGFWLSIIGTWLPMIFLFLIFIFFMRQLQAGGGKAMSFGKSKHHVITEANNRITFKDIAGADEAKNELQEIIEFLRDPKKFTRLGGRIPKGVLLTGQPGTGKTLLARGVAGEADVPFFSISGSDFVEMFVGVGASRVRDLFETGKKNAPCIIFVDEIDAVGRHRGAGLGGGHDEREQTLNQLLVEMDGFESSDGVIIVAATNRPDVLDPALLRPGRFDRRVVVPLPDVGGREGILKVHTRKVPVAKSVELKVIARGTPGFSGADLENLVNEAALAAARQDQNSVEMTNFEFAKDKVLMGTERRSMVISDEQKRETAYHEAGHTLVAVKTPHTDPVHKVTIIPRGPSLGLTQQLPEEDKYSQDADQVLAIIAVLMGGRAAEDIFLNKATTGAGNDIERATNLARRFVTEWGMSNLGPLAFGESEQPLFLGREMQRRRDISEQTAIRIDREIKRIVSQQYDYAVKLLDDNRDAMERLAQALLEMESLNNEEIHAAIDGSTIEEIQALRAQRKQEEADRVDLANSEPSEPAETDDTPRTTPSIVPLKPGGEET